MNIDAHWMLHSRRQLTNIDVIFRKKRMLYTVSVDRLCVCAVCVCVCVRLGCGLFVWLLIPLVKFGKRCTVERFINLMQSMQSIKSS